jgi:hypothetical protein
LRAALHQAVTLHRLHHIMKTSVTLLLFLFLFLFSMS